MAAVVAAAVAAAARGGGGGGGRGRGAVGRRAAGRAQMRRRCGVAAAAAAMLSNVFASLQCHMPTLRCAAPSCSRIASSVVLSGLWLSAGCWCGGGGSRRRLRLLLGGITHYEAKNGEADADNTDDHAPVWWQGAEATIHGVGAGLLGRLRRHRRSCVVALLVGWSKGRYKRHTFLSPLGWSLVYFWFTLSRPACAGRGFAI